jgi:hypothetical protein
MTKPAERINAGRASDQSAWGCVMAQEILTAARLRELLHYDPETGVFTRLIRTSNSVQVGDVAGSIGVAGYMHISVAGAEYYAHRIAWLWVHGVWPENHIDHVDGIRRNNRIANLRDAQSAINHQNLKRPKSNNKSGFLGVHQHPTNRNWVAGICVNSKSVHLGCYLTPELASMAYLEAKRRLHAGCTI